MAHGKPRDAQRTTVATLDPSVAEQRSERPSLLCPARPHTASFYAWRRRLQQRDAAAAFVPVHVVPDESPSPPRH